MLASFLLIRKFPIRHVNATQIKCIYVFLVIYRHNTGLVFHYLRLAMVSVQDIADYFLTSVDEEVGDGLSNLKLQKLVYYAQGFYLALFGKPLFADPIEAWTHGPVVPALYHDYKCYGSGLIPRPEDFDPESIDLEIRELLNEVYTVFGQFSAWRLRDMTHEEAPWQQAYASVENRVISHEAMQKYFLTQLKK
jgi:uncharacterized phage-associated protein